MCVCVVSLALSVVLRPPARRLALIEQQASLARERAAAAAGGASQALDERCGDDTFGARRLSGLAELPRRRRLRARSDQRAPFLCSDARLMQQATSSQLSFGSADSVRYALRLSKLIAELAN